MVKQIDCVCEKGYHYSKNQVKKCRRAKGMDKKAVKIRKKNIVPQGASLKDLRSRIIIMNSHEDNVLKHGNLQRYLDSDYQRTPAIQRANEKYLRLSRAMAAHGAKNQKTPARIKRFFAAYHNALCCLVRMFIFNKQLVGRPKAHSMSAAWSYITKYQQTKEFGRVNNDKLTQDQRDFQNLIRQFPTEILLFRKCLDFERQEEKKKFNWVETDLQCFTRAARQTWWRFVTIQLKDTTPYKIPQIDQKGNKRVDQKGNIVYETIYPKPGLAWDLSKQNVKNYCAATFEKVWFFQSQRRHYSEQFKLNYYSENKTKYYQFKQPWDAVKQIALVLENKMNVKYGQARCYDWAYGEFVGAAYRNKMLQEEKAQKSQMKQEKKIRQPLEPMIDPAIAQMQKEIARKRQSQQNERRQGYSGAAMFTALKNQWLKMQSERTKPIRRLLYRVLVPVYQQLSESVFASIKKQAQEKAKMNKE